MCSNPTVICQKIIKTIYDKMQSNEKTVLTTIRFIEMCGYVAIRILGYLDTTVYRELKRRNYLTEARKENCKNKKNTNDSKKSARKSASSTILESNVSISIFYFKY